MRGAGAAGGGAGRGGQPGVGQWRNPVAEPLAAQLDRLCAHPWTEQRWAPRVCDEL